MTLLEEAAAVYDEHALSGRSSGAFRDRAVVAVASVRAGATPRLGGYDLTHARTLAETWDDLPPILVDADTMTVIDGHHRLVASRLRGDDTIEVELFRGDTTAAFAEAIRRNIAHGKPLNIRERERAATTLIEVEPAWSNRRIAVICGLSDKTVAAIRERMTMSHPQLREVSARVGADGKTRPTDPANLRRRIADAVAAAPSASAREIAAAVGASQATVLDVRRRIAQGESPVPAHMERRQAAAAAAAAPASCERAWASDTAIASAAGGERFASWFASTDLHDDDWASMVDDLPLSRAYELAAEARRRAASWAAFADRIEARTRT